LVSNDPQFTSDPDKTRSGIDYPKLVRSYKKLILKFQTSNSERFDELIQFYDNIIFDVGIKKTLGKDREKPQEKSSGSEIDFKTDSEANSDGWYDHGHFDAAEAQPHTTSDLDIVMPPVPMSTVQPTASTSSLPASQPVRQAQSLGLGLPPVIRQSDSVRRQVTPIPSGQFCAPPSPILDHNLDLSNETPPSPDAPQATPADQLSLPAPADQPPAPSKR